MLYNQNWCCIKVDITILTCALFVDKDDVYMLKKLLECIPIRKEVIAMVCCTCSFKIVNIANLFTVKGLTSKTNRSQLFNYKFIS